MTNQGVVIAEVTSLPDVKEMGCLVSLKGVHRDPKKHEQAQAQQLLPSTQAR